MPVAALAITSAGLVGQRSRIDRLEGDLASISQWTDHVDPNDPQRTGSRGDVRLDAWKHRFESRFRNLEPREDAMLLSIEMRRFAQGLSTEECHIWLDEIGNLDLPSDLRKVLEAAMISALADRDPEDVLLRLGHRLGEPGSQMHWVFASVFRKWCEIDSSAAIRWLDEQIAAGNLESRALAGSGTRLNRFELVAIPVIAKLDLEAAVARFTGLSDGHRREIISVPKIHSLEDAFTWIEITRRSGRGDEHRDSTKSASSEVFRLGGYPEISRLIERIGATREERNWITGKAIRIGITNQSPPKPATYQEARGLIDQLAPEDRHSLAGVALASYLNHSKFEDLAEIALSERDLPGGEVMFYHFLRDSAARAPEMLGKLAETLKDPDQRREIADALPRERPSNIDPFASP